MGDIWSFLLQTLTASGVALVLLAAKAMLRDKLSPRWQFAVWGLPALVLLIPAGLGGRYVLVNWPLAVETARSLLTGEYGVLTRVLAPVPLLPFDGPPRTVAAWLHCVYAAGAALLLGRYAVSYIRLRLALRRGSPAGDAAAAGIAAVAEQYGLPACPAVEVPGLSSAFVCGVFHPVLALPAEAQTDEKVILHELLHLKHHDAAWGLVICLFRCVHWCNPLLWHCADLAANDLEALCDQRVLERLEGEDRRDYGRILLSMANEKYARAPGTSSMANGGKNIRRRIEAIARFKKYPAGMGLVSVCAALVLAGPCLIGTRAQAIYHGGSLLPAGLDGAAAMASARTTYCTTYAGALDAYAKAVLTKNTLYRAMCAPLSQQNALAAALDQPGSLSSLWAGGPAVAPDCRKGYAYYNLAEAEDGVWEGLLVVETGASSTPERTVFHLAAQPVRAEREGPRWAVTPAEPFQLIETEDGSWTDWGCEALPARRYRAEAAGFEAALEIQTVCHMDFTPALRRPAVWPSASQTAVDVPPAPHAAFETLFVNHRVVCTCLGNEADRAGLRSIGFSYASDPAELRLPPSNGYTGGSSSGSDGSGWSAQTLEGNWDPVMYLGGGGTGQPYEEYRLPDFYAAQLFLNGALAAELTLLPAEGGLQ